MGIVIQKRYEIVYLSCLQTKMTPWKIVVCMFAWRMSRVLQTYKRSYMVITSVIFTFITPVECLQVSHSNEEIVCAILLLLCKL